MIQTDDFYLSEGGENAVKSHSDWGTLDLVMCTVVAFRMGSRIGCVARIEGWPSLGCVMLMMWPHSVLDKGQDASRLRKWPVSGCGQVQS